MGGRGVSRIHDFNSKLETSKGARSGSDMETLAAMFRGVEDVVPASQALDRQGVDYVVRFVNGGEVYVDVKTREPGCARFWKHGEPELALELWSKRPNGKYLVPRDRARIGWTIDPAKRCHYVLFTYSAIDSEAAFLLPFMQLREAVFANGANWKQWFNVKVQDSGSWESEAVFVPVGHVLDAIAAVQRGVGMVGARQLSLAGAAAMRSA